MEIRFKVNQAEAFRRGVAAPKSIVRLEIDPGVLDQATRNLIADRMDGIDVRYGQYDDGAKRVKPRARRPAKEDEEWGPLHIEVPLGTLEELIIAVKADEARVQRQRNSAS